MPIIFPYDDMPILNVHKNVAEIDTDALAYNYKLLCSLTPGTRHICAVKADAYGHVADICVPVLCEAGCDFFAVSCIEEAISVRRICNMSGFYADVIILGYTSPFQVRLLSEYNIIQTAVSRDHAMALSNAAVKAYCTVRVHVAVDTGMNRVGIVATSAPECEKAAAEIKEISHYDGLKVEGIFTHFAKSDESEDAVARDDGLTVRQAKRFVSVMEALEAEGIKLFSHACNSAAAVRFPNFAFDAVRFGIMLYGVYPSEYVARIGIKPVMCLKSMIAHIHTLEPGESVSYGGTYSADRRKLIATLPIGYADGVLRAYSGSYVTVCTDKGDFYAQIVGRVCMDQCMIDVSNIPASIGDEVVIFGKDARSLEALAARANTIEYECLCLVSGRVPRITTDNYKYL